MLRPTCILASAIIFAGSAPPSTIEREIPSPRKDFYTFVNSDWLGTEEIPSEVPWISPFVVNTLRVQSQVRELIVEVASDPSPDTHPQADIAAFYSSFMDDEAATRAGLSPLKPVLSQIRAASRAEEIATMFGRLASSHNNFNPNSLAPSVTPVAIGVWNDRSDATKTALVLSPGGLGLPDRAYYLDAEHADTRLRYLAHIERILQLAGLPDARQAAAAALSIETELARARLPAEQLHDVAATWHPIPRAKIDQRFAGVAATRMLMAAGVSVPEEIVVTEPAYFERLGVMMTDERPSDWQAYLRWQVLRRYSPYLSASFRNADFAFYGKQIMGNVAPRPRDELAGLAVEAAFPNEVGRLWAERYVDPRTKADVRQIAEAVRGAFARRIERNDRYDPKTRAAALQKLANLRIEVAYPDQWPAARAIRMSPDDLIGNLRRLSAAEFRDEMQRLGRPVDRGRWYAGPQDTSAYYVRSTNTLAVPAGLLQAPWYDAAASPAENFGGVGTVIGHEMGHAFDDQGARFDAVGNLRDWWTAKDAATFEAENAKLVRQYEMFKPLPGVRLNGRLTVSEAYGDLIGLTVAYDALLAQQGTVGSTKQTKQYLASFCRHWRAKYREPLLRRIVASDGHAPQKYRCNGPVSAFPPFYEAFGVRSGDGMFLPTEDRAAPW